MFRSWQVTSRPSRHRTCNEHATHTLRSFSIAASTAGTSDHRWPVSREPSEAHASFQHHITLACWIANANFSQPVARAAKLAYEQKVSKRKRCNNTVGQYNCWGSYESVYSYRRVGPTQAVSVLSISCKIRSCSVIHSRVSFSAMIVMCLEKWQLERFSGRSLR